LRSHRRWLTTAMDVRGMRDSSRVALTRGSLRACRTTDMVLRRCRVGQCGVSKIQHRKRGRTKHRRLVLRHGDVKVVDLIICSQKRRETVEFTRPSLSAGRYQLASLHADERGFDLAVRPSQFNIESYSCILIGLYWWTGFITPRRRLPDFAQSAHRIVATIWRRTFTT
jgi:hypothetical protein